MHNECRCKFYKRIANETTTRRMRLICVYGIAGVFTFSYICQQLLNQLIPIQILLIVRIPPLFYTMLANLCKRLTITTNSLLLIRMACNRLRICCEYVFLTKSRNMFLIFAIPLERSECLIRIKTNVWRRTCEHCDL